MRFSFKKTLATILSIALILSAFVGVLTTSAADVADVPTAGTLSMVLPNTVANDANQFDVVANISLEEPSVLAHLAFTLSGLPSSVSLVNVAADNGDVSINEDTGAIFAYSDEAISSLAITMTFQAPDTALEAFELSIAKIVYADESETDEVIAVAGSLNVAVVNHAPSASYSFDDNYHWFACQIPGCDVHSFAKVEHSFADDGKCSCGKVQVVEPEEPELLTFNGISRAKSLSLKDVVYVNPVVAFVDVVDGKNVNAIGFDKAYALANGKILFWEVNPGDNAVIGTEKSSSTLEDYGVYKKDGIQEYSGKSMGISARKFADTIYYRTYIVVDGVEYYGDIIEYSVQTYCYNQINKNKQASLCATLLNYGSAAQINFNHNVDNLANAVLPGLVEAGKLDAKYLELNFDESVLVPANTPAENMTVNFAQDGAKITSKTLSLTGAIEAKVTMGYKLNGDFATQIPADASLKFYFWTSADYDALAAAGTPLTKENASSIKTYGVEDEVVANAKHSKYGYEYYSKPDPIAARKLGETFYYAAVVTEADGSEYCTGVQGYSPYQYVINQLPKTSVTENTKNLCRWIAVYGAEAKATLG